jgi:capsular polysaccharide biosynthesis protein
LLVKHLVAPSFLTQTGIVRREVPRFLRRAWRHVDSLGYDKVYVSRVGIPGRAIENEAEIEGEYRNKGFHIFRPHECAFWEQVATMMSAREIVGPHGGGLANCVFAPAGAKVTEIATNGHKPHHLTLAAVCGHTHERLEWFR